MERIDWSKAPHWADRVVRSPRHRQLFWASEIERKSFKSGHQGVNNLHIRDNWEVVERRPDAPKYCESVMRQMPGVTIEQRIASLRALEKQVEETRAELTRDLEALGLTWMVRDEPEQTTITDWRDLRVGDVVEYVSGTIGEMEGKQGAVHKIDEHDPVNRLQVKFNDDQCFWCSEWRFIRRP